MAYERCVRKKLRSLFEYLDHDKDGRITPSCLQSGLIRLQNYSMESSTKNGTGACSSEYPQICEYEIEELLRAVPRYDNPLFFFPHLSSPLLLLHTQTHTHIHSVLHLYSCIMFLYAQQVNLSERIPSHWSCPILFYNILSHHITSCLICFFISFPLLIFFFLLFSFFSY